MVCKKCGSENVNIQAVTKTKTKSKGLFYWLTLQWLVELVVMPFIFVIRLFKPKKMVSKTYKMAICQNCGKSWKV